MQPKSDLKPKVKDYVRLGWAILKLFAAEPGLLLCCLPRKWRGGYRSPWDDPEQ